MNKITVILAQARIQASIDCVLLDVVDSTVYLPNLDSGLRQNDEQEKC